MEKFIKHLTAHRPTVDFIYKKEHGELFSILEKAGILRHRETNVLIPCDLCYVDHYVEVYRSTITCGRSSRKVEDDEVKVWFIERDVFAEKVREELGIEGFAVEESEKDGKLFNLGDFSFSGKTSKVFLSFQENAEEYHTLFFHNIHNVHNMHNIVLYPQKNIKSAYKVENTVHVPLYSLLSGDFRKCLFEKKKLEKFLKDMRKVSFLKGVLIVDGEIVASFSQDEDEYWFLDYLYKHYGEVCKYEDMQKYMLENMDKKITTPSQKYCQNLKSKIKKLWKDVDRFIITNRKNTYTLIDPKRET